jgi:hypothetical protein
VLSFSNLLAAKKRKADNCSLVNRAPHSVGKTSSFVSKGSSGCCPGSRNRSRSRFHIGSSAACLVVSCLRMGDIGSRKLGQMLPETGQHRAGLACDDGLCLSTQCGLLSPSGLSPEIGLRVLFAPAAEGTAHHLRRVREDDEVPQRRRCGLDRYLQRLRLCVRRAGLLGPGVGSCMCPRDAALACSSQIIKK